NLMGNIYYRYGEFSQSKKYYSESLKMNDKNPIALNNFTLALLKDHNPTVFQSYAKRYPEIERYRSKELYLKEIKLRRGVLWGRLFNFSGDTFSLGKLVSGTLGECFKLPVFYFLILFILYVTLLKKITPNLGESTFCSKCSRIIKEASVHRSYKLCDECYQLFSIKDVIFLEAKILKEKELKKKFKKKFFVFILFSVLIPGLNFSQRENNRLFVALCGAFYFLLGFAVVGFINFDHIFSASPLFLNLFGIIAVGFYFFVNLFSVLGDKDGI
ncbi:MAG: hypothetical protein GY940_20840, partial [bacterium]|nr:hypothetical protein [bacterium]